MTFLPSGIFTNDIFTIWHIYQWHFYHLAYLPMTFLPYGIFTNDIFTYGNLTYDILTNGIFTAHQEGYVIVNLAQNNHIVVPTNSLYVGDRGAFVLDLFTAEKVVMINSSVTSD